MLAFNSFAEDGPIYMEIHFFSYLLFAEISPIWALVLAQLTLLGSITTPFLPSRLVGLPVL